MTETENAIQHTMIQIEKQMQLLIVQKEDNSNISLTQSQQAIIKNEIKQISEIFDSGLKTRSSITVPADYFTTITDKISRQCTLI